MSPRIRSLVAMALLALALAAPGQAGRTEDFVQDLYRRFAYRQATPSELQYWGPLVERMDPDRAEKRLKNWFFVHAVYKTSLGRTVTIYDVERTVDLLDSGVLDFRAVQYSVFHSPEYARAKQQGLAGTMMVPLARRDPS